MAARATASPRAPAAGPEQELALWSGGNQKRREHEDSSRVSYHGRNAARARAPAAAASAAPTPIGSFAIASTGQGGWAGGPLYSDGTIGGGGAFSFANGQEILRITGGTWAGKEMSGVTICASVTAVKDPLGLTGAPLCLGPLAVNAGPQLVSGALVKVSLR